MGMGMKMSRKGSTRNAKSASNAINARLLNNTSSDSSGLKSSTLPRKRAASPSASRSNTDEKAVKRERVSTPTTHAAQGTPAHASQTAASSRGSTPAQTNTERDENKPLAKLQRESSYGGAPSSDGGAAGEREEELELSEEAESPSGFSVSSDSDSEANGGLSDGGNAGANEDTLDDVEFDLDEIEDASDNDVGEVDIDAELEDSDENEDNDDV